MANFIFEGAADGLSGEAIHGKLLEVLRTENNDPSIDFPKPELDNDVRFCFAYNFDVLVGYKREIEVPADEFEAEMERRNAQSLPPTQRSENPTPLRDLIDEEEQDEPETTVTPGLQEPEPTSESDIVPGLARVDSGVIHRLSWHKFKRLVLQPILTEFWNGKGFEGEVTLPDPYLKGIVETPLSKRSFGIGFHDTGWLRIVYTEADA